MRSWSGSAQSRALWQSHGGRAMNDPKDRNPQQSPQDRDQQQRERQQRQQQQRQDRQQPNQQPNQQPTQQPIHHPTQKPTPQQRDEYHLVLNIRESPPNRRAFLYPGRAP